MKLTAVATALFILGTAVGPAEAQQRRRGGWGRPAIVVIDKVKREPMVQTIPVIGRLVARQAGEIATRIGGTVENIEVHVGDRVKKGDVLATLRSDLLVWERELRAANVAEQVANIANAEAQLGLSRQTLSRITKLRRSAAFSQARYEDQRKQVVRYESSVARAKAKLHAAQASLKITSINIEDATIRAPYPGVVTQRHTEVGAYLKVGDGLVSVLNDRDLEIEADVPAVRVPGLQPGTVVEIESRDEVKNMALVRAVVPDENPLSRTRAVRFELRFDTTRNDLARNQSVVLLIPVGTPRVALSVHKDAVLIRQGNRVVYVVEEDRAKIRQVELGDAVGGRFEVLSGLKPGDRVVVRGNERLRPNQKVKIKGAGGETSRPSSRKKGGWSGRSGGGSGTRGGWAGRGKPSGNKPEGQSEEKKSE